jgi:hypothetical protein
MYILASLFIFMIKNYITVFDAVVSALFIPLQLETMFLNLRLLDTFPNKKILKHSK